jgi:hypothetical protein
MLPLHIEIAPGSAYLGTEEVMLTTLDAMKDRYLGPDDRAFLKIDAQGYERQILHGAQETVGRLVGLQIEVSFVPLYEGQAPFGDLLEELFGKGFMVVLR